MEAWNKPDKQSLPVAYLAGANRAGLRLREVRQIRDHNSLQRQIWQSSLPRTRSFPPGLSAQLHRFAAASGDPLTRQKHEGGTARSGK